MKVAANGAAIVFASDSGLSDIGCCTPPLLRLKPEPMLYRLINRRSRKWQLERAPVIVRVPLIVEVVVEKIARLSVDDIQRRAIEVRHVGSEALRRTKSRANLLDG